MAWQFPTSTSNGGAAVDLDTTDSVFVAKGVMVASTGSVAIYGSGSNHQVIIAGTAVSDAATTVYLGGATLDHDG